MAAYKVHVFPDMIAALQQVPLGAVGVNEQIRQREGG